MERYTRKIWLGIYATPFISLCVLLYIWNSTHPGTAGPLGVLFVFIFLYLFWASIFFIFLHATFAFFKKTKLFGLFMTKRENKPFNWRMSYYIASIVAFVPVLLLAMQSVNQLSIGDILLVLVFALLAIFYITRRI